MGISSFCRPQLSAELSAIWTPFGYSQRILQVSHEFKDLLGYPDRQSGTIIDPYNENGAKMKKAYRLFKRRNGVYYLHENSTNKQVSLRTRDKDEAKRLRDLKNGQGLDYRVQRAAALATLRICAPDMASRTWKEVFHRYCERGEQQTRERKVREFSQPRFDGLRDQKLIETCADDFYAILDSGGVAAQHFLRRLHNFANEMGWLVEAIIPVNQWPKRKPRKQRGITEDEHQKILGSEKNEERSLFYQLLWETGASQKDCAELNASNVDWENKILIYERSKTKEIARLGINEDLESILRRLPSTGPLFPTIRKTSSNARSAEFSRRRKVAGVSGVSLHSYRYRLAERMAEAGINERFAQAALGQRDLKVHRKYWKGAEVVCPAIPITKKAA